MSTSSTYLCVVCKSGKPTSVNDSKLMFFGLDTGAFTNLLSLRAARQVAKVSSDYRDRVSGLNDAVDKVYSSEAKSGKAHAKNFDVVESEFILPAGLIAPG